jgi:hypothetical protein
MGVEPVKLWLANPVASQTASSHIACLATQINPLKSSGNYMYHLL